MKLLIGYDGSDCAKAAVEDLVLAGLPHPDLCQRCLDRAHPGFDGPEGA